MWKDNPQVTHHGAVAAVEDLAGTALGVVGANNIEVVSLQGLTKNCKK